MEPILSSVCTNHEHVVAIFEEHNYMKLSISIYCSFLCSANEDVNHFEVFNLW